MYTWNAYAKERANFEEKEELYKKKKILRCRYNSYVLKGTPHHNDHRNPYSLNFMIYLYKIVNESMLVSS
jgi:hypothetical protein